MLFVNVHCPVGTVLLFRLEYKSHCIRRHARLFIRNLFVLQDMPYNFIKDQVGIQNTPTLYWCDNDIIFAWVLEKTRSNCTVYLLDVYFVSLWLRGKIVSWVWIGRKNNQRFGAATLALTSNQTSHRYYAWLKKKANKQKSQLDFNFFASLLFFGFCSLNYLVFWHYKEVFLVALL